LALPPVLDRLTLDADGLEAGGGSVCRDGRTLAELSSVRLSNSCDETSQRITGRLAAIRGDEKYVKRKQLTHPAAVAASPSI
jgi:hypothetical protein